MKTANERVAALRGRAAAAGLKRLELYAHPDDWPEIQAIAKKLRSQREPELPAFRSENVGG